ncbi:hypothetical protein FRZ44_11590 [Hypericibacter terrae]|uniref:Uncharacterized protein n=1 Tax=Hypericibacter terrae TaxID=2602015 RepID=A0A5J6MFJ2_9PROT|nr:hypothetical protein FRZ44_11590 [Hypericibacter terrae]
MQQWAAAPVGRLKNQLDEWSNFRWRIVDVGPIWQAIACMGTNEIIDDFERKVCSGQWPAWRIHASLNCNEVLGASHVGKAFWASRTLHTELHAFSRKRAL